MSNITKPVFSSYVNHFRITMSQTHSRTLFLRLWTDLDVLFVFAKEAILDDCRIENGLYQLGWASVVLMDLGFLFYQFYIQSKFNLIFLSNLHNTRGVHMKVFLPQYWLRVGSACSKGTMHIVQARAYAV